MLWALLLPALLAAAAGSEVTELELNWPNSIEGDDSQKFCCNKYVNLTESHHRTEVELVKVRGEKAALQVEVKLRTSIFDDHVNSLKSQIESLRENCYLRTSILKINVNQAEEKLKECTSESRKPSQMESFGSPENTPSLTELKTGSYYISNMTLNWHMAATVCKSIGLDLISIESKEENDELTNALDKESSYWTSGTDLGSEGLFYWSATGQPFSIMFHEWAQNQPDNHRANEHCVHVMMARNSTEGPFKWNDSPCEMTKKYLCEAK